MLATVATSFLSAPQRRRFTMGILRAVRVPQDLRGAGSFEFHCLEGKAQLQRRNRGGRGGDRTPGLIVANDSNNVLPLAMECSLEFTNSRLEQDERKVVPPGHSIPLHAAVCYLL